jgi:RimJ/RimL family protein N-acetyltransferase
MGYALDPTWHGQGFGTEIVGALLSLTFDDVGLHRVTAGCFAGDIGSCRVMEKWGMRREQHGVQDSWHAEHSWVDGYT